MTGEVALFSVFYVIDTSEKIVTYSKRSSRKTKIRKGGMFASLIITKCVTTKFQWVHKRS